jgi:hypothetical protein
MRMKEPGNGQRRRAQNVLLWSSLIGLAVIVFVIGAALWLAPDARVQTNASDQPNAPATEQNAGRTGTTGQATGSGSDTRLGSGPAGSGTGSPTGSSGNVTGSTPAESGQRLDAPGTATR